MSKDPELERLFSRISALEAEYQSACSETDFYKNQMNQEWSSLHDLQVQYRELKEQADEEFRSASLCWEMGDRVSAKEHSENGKALNERKAYLSSGLDMAHSRYDPLKAAFDQAKERQTEVLERLKEARAAKNRRLDELKEEKAAEDAHWHEKSCQGCGTTIRYRDDWSHVPNYCKECKAKFDAEKKYRKRLRREKPCKGCGALIVYYEDWDHIPNYCKECKDSFQSDGYKLRFDPNRGKNDFLFGTDKPKKHDGHGHVVIDDSGNVHYVRDQYDPKKKHGRNEAVSYDDKKWL